MKHLDQSSARWHSAAKRTVAELKKRKAGELALYHATRDKRYELKAWLTEQTLDHARQVLKMREKELRGEWQPVVAEAQDADG
jgi:hypothetical protein